MKTINEMATDYMNDNRLALYDEDTGEVELVASLDIRLAYKQGANAVLDKIEALDLGESPYLISVEQAYCIINKLVKQLKGE